LLEEKKLSKTNPGITTGNVVVVLAWSLQRGCCRFRFTCGTRSTFVVVVVFAPAETRPLAAGGARRGRRCGGPRHDLILAILLAGYIVVLGVWFLVIAGFGLVLFFRGGGGASVAGGGGASVADGGGVGESGAGGLPRRGRVARAAEERSRVSGDQEVGAVNLCVAVPA